MPFFSNNKQATSPKYSKLAQKLARAVMDHKKQEVSWNNWSKDIRLLHSRDRVPLERIQAALNIYCDHIGADGCPKIYSGKALRAKFYELEAWTAQYGGSEYAPEINKLATKLKSTLRWPMGSHRDVEHVAQLTLERYTALREIITSHKFKEPRLIQFQKYLQNMLPAPIGFTEFWMRELQETINEWDGWNGTLTSMVLTWDSRRLDNYMENLSYQYSASPRLWMLMRAQLTDLLKEVK